MRLSVTKAQMEFLKTLGVADRDYTREEIDDIIEGPVSDCLMEKGWKPGSDFEETNEIGDLCEAIITALTKDRPKVSGGDLKTRC